MATKRKVRLSRGRAIDEVCQKAAPMVNKIWTRLRASLREMADQSCPYQVGEKIRLLNSEGKIIGYFVISERRVYFDTNDDERYDDPLGIDAQVVLHGIHYYLDGVRTANPRKGAPWKLHLDYIFHQGAEAMSADYSIKNLWAWHDEDQLAKLPRVSLKATKAAGYA